jgi:hypothetical protein
MARTGMQVTWLVRYGIGETHKSKLVPIFSSLSPKQCSIERTEERPPKQAPDWTLDSLLCAAGPPVIHRLSLSFPSCSLRKIAYWTYRYTDEMIDLAFAIGWHFQLRRRLTFQNISLLESRLQSLILMLLEFIHRYRSLPSPKLRWTPCWLFPLRNTKPRIAIFCRDKSHRRTCTVARILAIDSDS